MRLKSNNIDPTTTSDFSHSAFRYLHRLKPEFFSYYDSGKEQSILCYFEPQKRYFSTEGNIIYNVSISNSMGDVKILEKHYDDVTRGMFYQPVYFNGCRVENMVRLFKNSEGIGLDLFSSDILRGRDHGLQPYHVYVEACHNVKINSFDDLEPFISKEVCIYNFHF